MNGITCTISSGSKARTFFSRGLDAAAAGLLYAAVWGGLCRMAALSTAGVWFLAPGLVLAVPLSLAPKGSRLRRGAAIAGAVLCILLCLVWREGALCGAQLLLNRLFSASEAAQAYVYEMFPIPSGQALWLWQLRYALVPLGLFTALLCARWGKCLLFVLFAAGCGWLGVTPGTLWLVLLTAALSLSLLSLSGQEDPTSAAGVLILLAMVCAGVVLLFPGEDTRLSAWEETARDSLARQTVAYPGLPQPVRPTPPPVQESELPETNYYQTEETPVDLGGDEFTLTRPVRAALVILLFALLLFLPALLSDRLKRRRKRNRAPLEDPDHAAAIRAGFLYALRWLCLGGLPTANRPFGEYAGPIGELYTPELREEFTAVLPLWQEAAYSEHVMTSEQRAALDAFLSHAQTAAWDRMGKRSRLLARYVYAL